MVVRLKVRLKSFLGLVLITTLFGAGLPAFAQEPYNPEEALNIERVVATPDFVVSLMPDGSLQYYAILSDSSGFLVGVTPAGWRNDTLTQRAVDVVSRNEYLVLLLNLGAGQYRSILIRGGAELERGDFPGAGPVGSGVIVRASNTTAATVPLSNIVPAANVSNTSSNPAPANSGNRRDNGASERASGSFDGTFYTVVAGDNLYRIALRFNTTFTALMQLNNIGNVNLIYAGQRLRIP